MAIQTLTVFVELGYAAPDTICTTSVYEELHLTKAVVTCGRAGRTKQGHLDPAHLR